MPTTVTTFHLTYHMLSATSRPSSGSRIALGILNMPIDLVLVRHGASEGNMAFAQGRKGNNSLFTPTFMETHESKWRLTQEGKHQVTITGRWIRQHIGYHFGRYLTSEYVRALETAALLRLPHSNWERNVFLRERNFGRLASLSYDDRRKRFADEMKFRKRDSFYWTPPSGESLANLALRCDYILDSLAELPARPSSAILVTHFNVIQVFRTRIEMIRQKNFERDLIQVDEKHKIKNATVIHYTRRNPETKKIEPVYKWKRFATPWLGGEFADPKWEEINYHYLTNEDIEKDIREFPNSDVVERV